MGAGQWEVDLPGSHWTPIASYEPDGRDAELARTAADDAVAFVRSAGATLGPIARDALPQLLCPQLAFEPGTCPAADALLTSSRPLDRAPPWLAAIALVEHFDEAMPFTLLDLPDPPPELLARVRRSWVDIPVTIHRHEGPLG